MSQLALNFRIGTQAVEPGPLVSTSRAAYEQTKQFAEADREVMLLLFLDNRNALVGIETHSIGSIDCAAVYPREIFRSALMKPASGLVLVHNHPGGDPDPSATDKELTKGVVLAGKLLGIKVQDHIILGRDKYFSFCDQGLIQEYELAALAV